jgi:diguanylate cyclase (GGDEF)-like protein/PAS domain S-box-containing protein
MEKPGFPIAAKITAGCAVIFLAVLVLGAVCMERMAAINRVTIATRDDFLPGARALGQLRTTVRQYRLAEATLALAHRPADRTAAQTELHETAATVQRLREGYAHLTTGAADASFLQNFDRLWSSWQGMSARYLARLGADTERALNEEYFRAGSGYYEGLTALATDAIVANTRAGVAAADRAAQLYRLTRTLVIAALALALTASALVGVALTRTVSTPVRVMTAAMKRFAARDFSGAIPGAGRQDELGAMAEAMEVFRNGLIETERLRAQQDAQNLELGKSEARFRAIFTSVNEGVFVCDPLTRGLLEVNPAGCEMFGCAREELLGSDFMAHSSGVAPYTSADATQWQRSAEAHGPQTFEWHCRARDGHLFWAEISLRASIFGGREVMLATLRDVSDRKQAEAQIRHMARYDSLTGLPNRAAFVEEVHLASSRARRESRLFAVLFLDLDHFKDVNDTLGHPAGDQLLRVVSERLRNVVRATDTVARFGGDEFAVLAPEVRNAADAAALADKLIRAIELPCEIQGNDIRIGTSIGVGLYGAGVPGVEAMMSHVDVALYRAKSEGRGTYRFFTEAMDEETRARVKLIAELREAIAAEQLFLVYQPQVELTSGRITGIEALVRWRHPTRGVLTPDGFIREAESSGLIVALGQRVLREACRQGKRWHEAGILPGAIAINLSGAELRSPLELERSVNATLMETGLPPRHLEIELTETVLMGEGEHHATLARLRARGIRLAIDDFGTGYSSLDYLRRFPADRIKIAQSFVRQLDQSGNAAVVKATIGLARELGMAVIAEGIETRGQLETLCGWGCCAGQGFLFARPMLADALEPLLRAGVLGEASVTRAAAAA